MTGNTSRFTNHKGKRSKKQTSLVGGFNPCKKNSSNWIISPIFGMKLKHCILFKDGLAGPASRRGRGTQPQSTWTLGHSCNRHGPPSALWCTRVLCTFFRVCSISEPANESMWRRPLGGKAAKGFGTKMRSGDARSTHGAGSLFRSIQGLQFPMAVTEAVLDPSPTPKAGCMRPGSQAYRMYQAAKGNFAGQVPCFPPLQ